MHPALLARLRGILLCLLILSPAFGNAAYTLFESGQTRPLALSPDGTRLFAVNTPDNTLEIFNVTNTGLVLAYSVPVGLEPTAVAARNNNEIWVVNFLSDSVSIIDVTATPPRVMRTLLVGDEPGDIVFAGTGGNRAFITAAHRGQNSPYTSATNPGELITPGLGRADVWVFDAANLGNTLGGTPLTIIKLFGDTPKALTVSADGSAVYAAVHKSGNRTTTINEGAVCNGGATAPACNVSDSTAPGGLPAPNKDSNNVTAPETGLIVKFNGSQWVDELNRNWSPLVRFNLPDKDVFAINANANPPVENTSFSGVGTVLFNMIINPVNGNLYVSNTDAVNEVRFEGTRPAGSTISSVRGKLHKSRITVIERLGSGAVIPRHINPHINYASDSNDKTKTLATPRGMALNADASLLFVAAQGSSRIGVIPTVALENGSYAPNAANNIALTGRGPTGLVMDNARNRLYVLTRFDNAISVIDLASAPYVETDHITLHNPEPASVTAGRRFLYDADLSSANGEAACASCHIDADKDELAWDLGDPLGSVLVDNNPFTVGATSNFHPMKGPMTTQTLRGMNNHGPMHWRGDRSGANNAGGDALDEDAAFKKFNPAFVGLLGRGTELRPAEMQAFTDFILQVTPPPNPIRNLDNSLTTMQQNGRTFYFNTISDIVQTCNGCHELNESQGFFGANGQSSFESEPQTFKIAQLRNIYEKVGMFGMPAVAFFLNGDNGSKGDQIRGFGLMHDGSVDSLFRFLRARLFTGFTNDTKRREVEQFVFAFDSNLKPVVGQQITLTDSNRSIVDPRIDLLVARAAAGDADLIVKGIVNGVQRGWLRAANGTFTSDKAGEPSLTDTQLRALANDPQTPLTYLAVPPGSGSRIGLDRDDDSILNGDDNCPADPDPNQADLDGDGLGNNCDDDRDGDGLSNEQEVVIGSSPDNPDTDNDGLTDGDEVNDFLTNPLLADTRGDVAPRGAPDGLLNAGDYVVLNRLVIGSIAPTSQERAWADINQDSIIDLRDLLALQPLLGL